MLLHRGVGDGLRRDAEMLVDLLVGAAGAEGVHADKGAVMADHGVPAEADAGLDRDLDRGGADDRSLGGLVLLQQKLKLEQLKRMLEIDV